MQTTITVALIASFTSLMVSLYQTRQGRHNQRELEIVKLKLAEKLAERNARRDYEYKALQRLYEEYEPIRFQLLDTVECAKYHWEGLQQEIIWRQGWKSFLLLSTVYHLLTPAAVYQLARKSLTLVDLKVDPQIELQYLLAKKAYLVFTHDRQIAEFSGLEYTPYVEGWREKRIDNSQKYRRQGLPLGRLDNAVNSLLVPLTHLSEHERVISFGEFEQKFSTIRDDDVKSSLGTARDLFNEFHPEKHPVLWRILLTQYCLHKAILALADEGTFRGNWLACPNKWLTLEEKQNLQWAAHLDRSINKQDLTIALEGSGRYMQEIVVSDIKRIMKKQDFDFNSTA